MSDGAAAFRKLDELPRARLAHLPTPIEAMPNLAAALGGDIRLYVKRDDCTGLAFGDNKIRQLEFYMGEDEAADTDTILITGAVQSNFVRAAVTAARKLGMDDETQGELMAVVGMFNQTNKIIFGYQVDVDEAFMGD